MRVTLLISLVLALLYVAPIPAQTLVAAQDSYIDVNAPTTNFGSAEQIRLKSSPTEQQQAGLVRFDLSPILGLPLGRAILRLYVAKVSQGGDFSARKIESAWEESTVTFDTGPAFGGSVASQTVTRTDEGTYVELDITDLVADWLSGALPNHGVALVPDTMGMKAWFGSRETPLGPELVVRGKTDVTTVEKSGGDYADPVSAIDDLDAWCRLPRTYSDEDCKLMIGPGTFYLPETLVVPGFVAIIGAGRSGRCSTELVAMPGVDTAIEFPDVNVRNSIADLIVRRTDGISVVAKGISMPGLGAGSGVNPNLDLRNVSVEVSGGTMANVGIAANNAGFIENVDVTAIGNGAKGLHTNCAAANDVQILADAGAGASADGWVLIRDDCPRAVSLDDFDITVIGDDTSLGLGLYSFWDGPVTNGRVSSSGTGVVADGNSTVPLSNLEITAATTAIVAHEGGLSANNVRASATTGLTIETDGAFAEVAHSTLTASTIGILLEVPGGPFSTPTLRVDNSIIRGGSNAILSSGTGNVDVGIGSSMIDGAIDAGNVTFTCACVFDASYTPITCP